MLLLFVVGVVVTFFVVVAVRRCGFSGVVVAAVQILVLLLTVPGLFPIHLDSAVPCFQSTFANAVQFQSVLFFHSEHVIIYKIETVLRSSGPALLLKSWSCHVLANFWRL